jgi:hypothetical protein
MHTVTVLNVRIRVSGTSSSSSTPCSPSPSPFSSELGVSSMSSIAFMLPISTRTRQSSSPWNFTPSSKARGIARPVALRYTSSLPTPTPALFPFRPASAAIEASTSCALRLPFASNRPRPLFLAPRPRFSFVDCVARFAICVSRERIRLQVGMKGDVRVMYSTFGCSEDANGVGMAGWRSGRLDIVYSSARCGTCGRRVLRLRLSLLGLWERRWCCE